MQFSKCEYEDVKYKIEWQVASLFDINQPLFKSHSKIISYIYTLD
jgi:hypothetical protein